MKKILAIVIIAMVALVAMPANVFAADYTVSDLSSFKTAMTESGETVTLTADVVSDTETITITGNKTLDLAGHTLTLNGQLIVEGNLTIGGSGKIFSDNLYDMILVKPGATLIVNDANLEATAFKAGAIQILGETGKNTQVTINKEAVITANYPAYISKPGGQGITVDIYGTLNGLYTETADKSKTNGGSAFYINGNVIDTSVNAAVVNVYEGATLTGDKAPAVYAAGYAVWNISGGSFTGTEALSIKAGTFNITGGSFVANGEKKDPKAEGNASEESGAAISITSNKGYEAKKIELSVENADVWSENGYAVLEVATDVEENETTYVNKIELNSGIYYGGEEAISAENVDNFVKGGIYNTDVETYVDTTLDAVKDEETGEYYVGTLNKVNVKETTNGKVEVSLEEAIVEQFVEITSTPNEGYKVGTITVKDSTGKNVEVVDGIFLMPDSEVTVEVTFEKVEAAKDDTLDTTPATGYMDTVLFVSVAIAAVAMVAIVMKKQAMKNLV